MATREFRLLGAFEGHSVDEIRAVLDPGFDRTAPIKGRPVVNSLANITRLLEASGRPVPPLDNVPNRYLNG